MKAVVAAFNQEKALVGAFSVIVQPVVEPMERFAALVNTHHVRTPPSAWPTITQTDGMEHFPFYYLATLIPSAQWTLPAEESQI